MITYFQTVTNTSKPFYVLIETALQRIREGKSQQIVEQVRALTQKDARNEKKKLLPAICFSGKFEKRADTACIEHSGIICLDFDGFDSDQELEDFKFDLMLDKFTLSVFLSPSGDGLKVLVRIPKDIENHKLYFKGLEKYYNRK